MKINLLSISSKTVNFLVFVPSAHLKLADIVKTPKDIITHSPLTAMSINSFEKNNLFFSTDEDEDEMKIKSPSHHPLHRIVTSFSHVHESYRQVFQGNTE